MITIITKEELTYKVIASFDNYVFVSGLECLLDMLFDEGVNTLAAISAIADFDGVPIVA